MKTYLKRGAAIAAMGGFALASAGCYLPDGGGVTPGTGVLRVGVLEPLGERPDQPFDFDHDAYVVPHGDVDTTYFGPSGSPIPHTLKLRQIGGSDAIGGTIDLALTPGPTGTDSAEGTFDVPAGVYELYCDIPAQGEPGLTHADLGMTALLTVY